MNAYEPGTVAVATVRGVPNVRVFRYDSVSAGRSWASASGADGWTLHSDIDVTDVRPLVVIDPEDREQVNRLADAFCTARWSHVPGNDDECDPLTRSAMREALAAYIQPPKPPEPTGLGAVVEDADGERFVRQHDGWWRGDEPCTRNWAGVAAVRVLSEGVQP